MVATPNIPTPSFELAVYSGSGSTELAQIRAAWVPTMRSATAGIPTAMELPAGYTHRLTDGGARLVCFRRKRCSFLLHLCVYRLIVFGVVVLDLIDICCCRSNDYRVVSLLGSI